MVDHIQHNTVNDFLVSPTNLLRELKINYTHRISRGLILERRDVGREGSNCKGVNEGEHFTNELEYCSS